MPSLMATTSSPTNIWFKLSGDLREATHELLDTARERHLLTEKLLVLVGSGSVDDAVVQPPLIEGLRTHLAASRQGMNRIESYLGAMDTPDVPFQRLKLSLREFHGLDDDGDYVLAEQEADACLGQGLMELTERWQQDESEVERQLRLLIDALDYS
ncbi:MAG: hypothetical protein EG825_14565 [Rhodocyclaceae bacterium]|nr:hypothetical protein [Rhodocyclaceae bacterium]